MSIDIIFKHKGIVYGGFIRDLIGRDEPHDIDAVIPEQTYEAFRSEMLNNGFTETLPKNRYDPVIFNKDGELSVEVIQTEDMPGPRMYIGPTASPDFDVNLLAYDGLKMYNWMSLASDPDLDVLVIMSRIAKHETLQFEGTTENRIDKMKRRGYKIIGFKEGEY